MLKTDEAFGHSRVGGLSRDPPTLASSQVVVLGTALSLCPELSCWINGILFHPHDLSLWLTK